MLVREIYFSVRNLVKVVIFCGNPCQGGTKSKQEVIFLRAYSAAGSDKLPPVLIGKYRSTHCFKNATKLPTKYDASTNSWINIVVYEGYLT
jgi:hypothetical protein